jgi:ATP-dependent DNA helicase RecQ
MDKFQLLKRYWGFSKFRPYQQETIDSLLEGKDVIGILPTGIGKSLCYQLPSLIMDGPVLVISPLVALMIDQVKQLGKKGIKSMYFENDSKSIPLQQQIENSIYGNYKLIYCSPERFLNPIFIKQITLINFSLIAIDEAHCISELGHDFRPSYRRLDVIRNLFIKTPILAVSASATDKVIFDIRNLLKLKKAKLYKSSFERSNISYRVLKTENKFGVLIKLLNKNKGSSIIYCGTRRLAENLAQFINNNGYKSSFFHGGLSQEEKKKKLSAWKLGEVNNITATSAFGMGIDKSDVRIIIHFHFPESIESFYQETGRAGRDGKEAFSYLLYNRNDEVELKNQVLNRIPGKCYIEDLYRDLCNFFQIAYGEGRDHKFSLDLVSFCKRYNRSLSKTDQALKYFELSGVFRLIRSREKQLFYKITASMDQIIPFLQKNNHTSQLLEYLIRHKPILKNEKTNINLIRTSNILKTTVDLVIDEFKILNNRGILEFEINEFNIDITPLTPREDQFTLKPVIELVSKIYSIKKNKILAMIKFTQDDQLCKRNSILAYFGEVKSSNCKKCSSDSCIN